MKCFFVSILLFFHSWIHIKEWYMKSCSKIPYHLRSSSQLLITMTHTGHCELWKILLKANFGALQMRGMIPKSAPKSLIVSFWKLILNQVYRSTDNTIYINFTKHILITPASTGIGKQYQRVIPIDNVWYTVLHFF